MTTPHPGRRCVMSDRIGYTDARVRDNPLQPLSGPARCVRSFATDCTI